ncbi:hypothetical protein EVAR_33407_1 [Eumeta japonica]|uniref:Uncharacterized protein n=1 Tax=Eumeta variegata TaxID=151549 RepID=A0A4C1W2A6_EUMVA|nr:hypothetical protein EVAR_33407_1 [Eumeta japonica]
MSGVSIGGRADSAGRRSARAAPSLPSAAYASQPLQLRPPTRFIVHGMLFYGDDRRQHLCRAARDRDSQKSNSPAELIRIEIFMQLRWISPNRAFCRIRSVQIVALHIEHNAQIVTAARGHTQYQRSHRCVAGLLERMRYLIEGGSGLSRGRRRVGHQKSHSLDEIQQRELQLMVSHQLSWFS